MRVAALYDVHGNLPALEAVLAEVPDDAAIVVGGDVAAGPLPSEALERLRALGDHVHWIRGNADRELTPGEEGLGPPDVIEWVRDQLSAEQIGFLHGLPEQLELDVDGLGRVLFCHATPRNDVDIFLEGTPEEHVAPRSTALRRNSRLRSHAHAVLPRIAGIRVVNAGSVGMAYDDEPGAYWLALGPDIEHRRTQYEMRPRHLRSRATTFAEAGRAKADVTELFGAHAVGA